MRKLERHDINHNVFCKVCEWKVIGQFMYYTNVSMCILCQMTMRKRVNRQSEQIWKACFRSLSYASDDVHEETNDMKCICVCVYYQFQISYLIYVISIVIWGDDFQWRLMSWYFIRIQHFGKVDSDNQKNMYIFLWEKVTFVYFGTYDGI